MCCVAPPDGAGGAARVRWPSKWKPYTTPPPTPGVEATRRQVAKLTEQLMVGGTQLPEARRNRAWTREGARPLADSTYGGCPSGPRGGMPGEYLPGIARHVGADALEAQCIPGDPALWDIGRYEEFLAARREALAAAINSLVEPGGSPLPERCREEIAGGESLRVELKSSMLYDHKRNDGTANAELKRVLLKEIVAFMNAEGGTIYVGVSDDGTLLGIERDMRLLGKRAGWDKWSQALTNAVKTLGAAAARNVSSGPVKIDGKTIARIEVRRGTSPAYLDPAGKGEFVVRNDTASILLSTKEAAEYIRDRFPGRG